MSNDTMEKVEELIAMIDGPCNCDDGTCKLCRIMGLLCGICEEVERLSNPLKAAATP